MTRLVVCSKFKRELPGLERPPFPGPKGQQLFETVSQQAWQQWQEHQTRLINEKHLVMSKADDRRYLGEQMTLFLSDADFDQAEGYVPEAE
ncbi:MAG: Fe-S cluster biosynthesis and repair protein YggX [Reinekea sp.]|jgi:Fe-S cluster biosynthesis and repair protein YggX|uniref:oxidative damage protection protein n=1 Tax=Reinekea sp. TaxID=1970455 RepID=UPI002579E06C|nr:oxidative damage protection protein [Reinekea sp.]|tara:strand:- start:1187 stop:1459 length:273 start_codon:yes stop_codon:yes gene_type:complete